MRGASPLLLQTTPHCHNPRSSVSVLPGLRGAGSPVGAFGQTQTMEATVFCGKLVLGKVGTAGCQSPAAPCVGPKLSGVVEVLAEDPGGRLRVQRTHGAHGKLGRRKPTRAGSVGHAQAGRLVGSPLCGRSDHPVRSPEPGMWAGPGTDPGVGRCSWERTHVGGRSPGGEGVAMSQKLGLGGLPRHEGWGAFRNWNLG